MTLPSDDDRLVDFLRRHRPETPPASPVLETQIMAAIEAKRPSRKRSRGDRPPWRHRFAVPALAASVLLAWGGWVTLRTSPLPEADSATVDDFLAETWYGSAFGDDSYRMAFDATEPGWFLSVYATPY